MKDKLPQIMKYVGFGAVLVTALAISWQSMATMAMNNFGLPDWLAYAVSTAYDGAALFTAAIATEYAKTEDSGFAARLTTVAFVGLSAWLNLQHAQMMGLPLAGQVFYAAPAIIAGILFELMLKFENRQELRARGRVAAALPVLGKMAWLRYSKKSFQSMSKIIKHRMNEVTRLNMTISTAETDMKLYKITQKVTLRIKEALIDAYGEQCVRCGQTDKLHVDHIKPLSLGGDNEMSNLQLLCEACNTSKNNRNQTDYRPDNGRKVADKSSFEIAYKKPKKVVSDTTPDWLPDNPDMSVNKIAQTCYENQTRDIDQVMALASRVKGVVVSRQSVQKGLNRAKHEANEKVDG